MDNFYMPTFSFKKKEVYKCGWCGQLVNKNGVELSLEECKVLSGEKIEMSKHPCELCWLEQEQNQEQEILITREMAMDAQDLSLEGQIWKW